MSYVCDGVFEVGQEDDKHNIKFKINNSSINATLPLIQNIINKKSTYVYNLMMKHNAQGMKMFCFENFSDAEKVADQLNSIIVAKKLVRQ